MKIEQIATLQKNWGDALIAIGRREGDLVEFTTSLLLDLYDFENNDLAFKPTLCKESQFRKDLDGTLSYFIGGNEDYGEDKGFALNKWSEVRFENAVVKTVENVTIAMGNYFFTNASGDVKKVEYTFGYNKEGKIILHHSSLPYN